MLKCLFSVKIWIKLLDFTLKLCYRYERYSASLVEYGYWARCFEFDSRARRSICWSNLLLYLPQLQTHITIEDLDVQNNKSFESKTSMAKLKNTITYNLINKHLWAWNNKTPFFNRSYPEWRGGIGNWPKFGLNYKPQTIIIYR